MSIINPNLAHYTSQYVPEYQNPYNVSLADYANSIMTTNANATDVATAVNSGSSSSGDNADDGKISFGKKIGNFFKGIGKTVVNAVKSLNPLNPKNWGNILKTGLVVAASIACPAVGVAVCAYGAAKGAVTIAKGAAAASNATTDAEAEAAWQNMGSGTFQVGMSVVGAKAGLKAMKANPASAMGQLGKGAGIKATTKAYLKDAGTSAKAAGHKFVDVTKTAGGKASGIVKGHYANSASASKLGKAYDAVKLTTKDGLHYAKDAVKNTKWGEAYQNTGIDRTTLAGKAKAGFQATKNMYTQAKAARAAQAQADAAKGELILARPQGRFGKYGAKIKNATPNFVKNGYHKFAQAAQNANLTKFGAVTPGIVSNLDPAVSDEDMAILQNQALLNQYGYYNVY